MNSFKEKSTDQKNDLIWMWMSIFCLALWFLYDMSMIVQGWNKLADLIFIALFAGLLAWRFAFNYENSFSNNELKVTRRLLSFEQSITIPFDQVEGFSDKYKRKLLIRQRISSFFHWYSSGDPRTTRVMSYMLGKKRYVLIFKASDVFMDRLIAAMPDRFVPCI